MPNELKKEQYTKTEVEELMRKQSEELTEKVEVAEMVAEMTDAERAHYKSLTGDARQDFLFMEPAQRSKVLKSAEDDNPVVYKAANGDEFRQKDDPRMVKMAKERDEERKSFLKMQAKAAQTEFEKRAKEELPNFPGTVETRAAIIKAVDGIEDETLRDEAMKSLKANNAKMAKAFETVGTNQSGYVPGTDGSDRTAFDELDKKAKELVEKTEGLDYYTAFEQVSDRNPELAKRAVQEG